MGVYDAMLARTNPSIMTAPLRSVFLPSLLFVSFFAHGQWAQVNNGLTNLTQGAAVLGASPTHLFARGGGNFFRSDDQGDNWTAATTPEFLNPSNCGYYFADRYFAGLSSAQACIFSTEDEGATWTAATGAPTASVVRGFFEYGGALYAYTSNAGIYRTLDGASWAAVNNGLTNLNVIGMCAAGPYFLAATVGGGVFRTINAATWTAATGIASGDLNGEHIWTMGSNQYYSAQGGAVYRSTSGESWTAWTAPPQFGLGVVEVKRFGSRVYMEARHLAGGGQRDSVYFTTNGTSWTNITGNLNAADLNGSGLFEYEGDLFIGYSFVSPAQGLYRYSLSTGVDDAAAAITPVLFPNPAADQVTITMPDAIGTANITVHDAAGRAVLVLNALTGTERIDISGLPAGCYILRAEMPEVAPVRLVKH